MKNIRSKRRGLLIIFLAGIAAAAALFYMLPSLFQLPLVHEKTSAFIDRQIPGEVTYRKEALSLFPTPRIHLYDVHLKVDSQFSMSIDQVSATPHFLSLLRGRFNISKLTLSGIDAVAGLPRQPRGLSPEMVLAVLEKQLDTLADMLEPVRQKIFALEIADGALSLTRAEKPVFSIRNIDGRLTWQRPVISLEMSGRSDLWDQGRLTLETDPATRNISGRLTANNFRTTPNVDFPIAGVPFHLEHTALDADISWETEGFETWHFSVEALNPDITLSNDETRMNLRGKRAAAELRHDEAGLHASLSDLDLDTPGLRLSGKFEMETGTPHAGWQAEVDALDIASTRAAVLFFADRSKTARKIFQVLRVGAVSRLSIGQEADSLDDLRNVTTLHLQGCLEDATVFVPKADLLLTESRGCANVSRGILEISNIDTRLGVSTGSRGRFTMALTGEKPRPWSVAGRIRADLAQLPPLLLRLVKNAVFARELAGIESAEGSAEGILALDRSASGLMVTVDASRFDLSAVYSRIPFPVTLSGGRFFYQGRGIRLQGVKGAIGNSTFSDLAAGIAWKAAPHLSISSVSGEVAVNELASWLGDRFPLCRPAEDTETDDGRIHVAHLALDGPAGEPTAWQFQTEGNVESPVTVCTPLFPEALTVYRGSFSSVQNRIDFQNADLSVKDSRFTATGSLEGWLPESPWILDARFEGGMGPEVSRWAYRQAGIPEMLEWQTPMALSPLFLRWHETEGVRVSGEAAAPSGPRLALNIRKSAGRPAAGSLDILDAGSRATVSLARDETGITVGFSGNLDSDTVSAILEENRVLSGSLRGNASVRVDPSSPFFRSMTGRIRADRLDLSPFGLPLRITQASLTGNGASIGIEAARFNWEDIDFSSSGQVTRSGDGVLLDLTLATGPLDWPTVKALVNTELFGNTAPTPLLSGDIRFVCERFSLTPALTFEPFEALVKRGENRTDVVFRQAETCGISFPGTLTLMPDRMLFAFKPSAAQQSLEPTVSCLKKGSAFIDGRFDLTGDIAFQWDRSGSILEAIEGGASLTAVDGRIYRGSFLGKLFSMLNVSEVLSGQFPDFEKEGFPYKTSIFEGKFKDGKFELGTGVIDSPAMKIFFEGTEDLIKKRHALTVVVAPLRTVDSMVDKIPLLNEVLDKGLVVYPVKVTGDWQEPQLALLSPTAVGDEVLGIMLRTLKVPVTLLEKIFSGGSKTDQEKTAP